MTRFHQGLFKSLGLYIHFPQQVCTQNSKLLEYHKNEAMHGTWKEITNGFQSHLLTLFLQVDFSL
jgi:hypothetical protein